MEVVGVSEQKLHSSP